MREGTFVFCPFVFVRSRVKKLCSEDGRNIWDTLETTGESPQTLWLCLGLKKEQLGGLLVMRALQSPIPGSRETRCRFGAAALQYPGRQTAQTAEISPKRSGENPLGLSLLLACLVSVKCNVSVLGAASGCAKSAGVGNELGDAFCWPRVVHKACWIFQPINASRQPVNMHFIWKENICESSLKT